jgi:UDP-2,3-diacylglucosamine pyrophosphatase LpxH
MTERIFVISDLHIGGEAAPMLGHPGKLCRFLDELSTHQREGGETVELIINGDFVDFLALPPCKAWTRTENEAIRKLEDCLTHKQWSPVFQALGRAANHVDRFTVLLGNHDIELAYPNVRRRLLKEFGSDEHRCLFITNNEAYRRGDVHVEHGNRADAWNAIDYDGLRHLMSGFSRGEEVPDMEVCPGSKMVEGMVWALKKTYPFIDLLKPETKVLPLLLVALEPSMLDAFRKLTVVAQEWWKQLLRMQPWRYEIKPSKNKYISGTTYRTGLPSTLAAKFAKELTLIEKSVSMAAVTGGTGFDGLAASLKLGKKVPRERLEQIQEALRCALDGDRTFDGDSSDGPYFEAAKKLCGMAKEGMAAPRVVLMGHTHAPRALATGTRGVYLNTGTWVDMIRPPSRCMEDSEEGRTELSNWLGQLVGDSDKLRVCQPHYADITLNELGEIAQPSGRPMLCEYDKDSVFGPPG